MRNKNNPTTARNTTNREKEKFRIKAGIMATMGRILAAMYRLLWQNRPSPRSAKSLMSPCGAIFLESRFKPEMQSESFSR